MGQIFSSTYYEYSKYKNINMNLVVSQAKVLNGMNEFDRPTIHKKNYLI